MRADIGASLDEGGDDFELHYQPIVRVSDGAVYAFETLVRYHHDGALLPPGQFLDDVIRSGNMQRLTEVILRKALGEFRAARLSYPITVNVSPEHVGPSLITVFCCATGMPATLFNGSPATLTRLALNADGSVLAAYAEHEQGER